jgi:hypothetical protein
LLLPLACVEKIHPIEVWIGEVRQKKKASSRFLNAVGPEKVFTQDKVDILDIGENFLSIIFQAGSSCYVRAKIFSDLDWLKVSPQSFAGCGAMSCS